MTIAIKTQPRNSDKLYTHLLERKRVWTPTEAAKGFVAEGSENSLDRAMCLRKLELPVGEFIKSGCAKEDGLSDICITLLESNIQDEVKHDIALENLYRVCGQHNKKHEEYPVPLSALQGNGVERQNYDSFSRDWSPYCFNPRNGQEGLSCAVDGMRNIFGVRHEFGPDRWMSVEHLRAAANI